MMNIVNMQAAKTHLSRWVEEALQGEKIVLAKAGKPMGVRAPIDQTSAPRKGGRLKAVLGEIPVDLDEPSPEIGTLFRG
jgi:antitoxin (DNA-binding transcriptional repressor) of toxin-antitoxin stability system